MKELHKTSEPKIIEVLSDTRRYDDQIYKDEYFTLTNTVTQFRDEQSFNTLITHVLNNETLLNEILENSYRHHNGFHKIVLCKGALYKIRLHIFMSMPEVEIPMENIHNHRWNFASQIVKGKMKMEIFKKGLDGDKYYFDYAYKPANGGDNYEVDLLGLSPLELIEERIFHAGESYYMDCDEMHRIVNFPSEKVVTIVMTGIPNNKECKLYSKNIFAEERNEVIKYSRNDLIRILESI